jgi:hypothetical protein
MSEVLVFITATFDSGKTPQVKRSDPEERKQDYLTAFRTWMSLNCNADIIFCENSNADLSSFHEVVAEHGGDATIRLISFAGNAGAQHKGKGYGEIEMLRYAFDMMPELKDYRYIVKVSGRYRVTNGVKVIEQIRQMSADLICDIHANLTYGDTRTVAFKPHIALAHLIPYQDELDETRGIIIEHLMARCLHRTLLAGGSWAPLPCTPICDGISGSWNTPQRDTLLYRIKQDIKRRLAHWIYRY